ncbi:hypothetical protein K493DRAFT_332890 [Basidiobolus meristosporus CBS 931.73]|uniref:SWR1-complex protein 4 n=1 Tax=Basidiobolus meristosporus CBS 931.73 TaxID=1314790 RepID=A0A1Y1ZAC4_9FUNG|nr:hypothetical protein K493DRAFT_332890 [Basidiobolus meristosporus CBS 931.73]|eukprot:ORY07116.1 hypothetical protein K493DRAFT_332890 [Basidiobolus meristosporus CBS 931.73]
MMLLETFEQDEKTDMELIQLTGGVPPISISRKRVSHSGAKDDKWEWKGFTSSARGDDLILHHWARTSEEATDYQFAQFNKIVDLVEYTEEDYQQYLTQENWSKEETDYLFRLCEQYDLRFIVIADRYDFPGAEKSMEDMKERYYSVTSKMLAIRAARGEKINQERILAMSFDKEKEAQRKKNLEQLYARNQTQIEAEESLFFESLRFEQNARNLYKERENHLLLFNTKELHIPKTPVEEVSTAISPNPLAFPEGVFKSKKKKVLTKKDLKPSKEHALDASPSTAKEVTVVKQEPNEISTPLKSTFPKNVSTPKVTPMKTTLTPESAGSSLTGSLSTFANKKDKLPPGVHLRSTRIAPIKQSQFQKIAAVLEEYGIKTSRPIMPTATVCNKFDELLYDTLSFLDQKKQVEKLEHELKVIKHKIEELTNGASSDGSLTPGRKRLSLVSSKDIKKIKK